MKMKFSNPQVTLAIVQEHVERAANEVREGLDEHAFTQFANALKVPEVSVYFLECIENLRK